MLVEMFPAVFALITDEPDPVEICPHSKAFVFFLDLLVPGALLGERLMVQGQGQHDVRPNLTSVKCAVEPPEFHRMVSMEKAVQVQEMIAAVVIVLIAVFPIALVPDRFYIREGLGFSLVDPLY